MMMSRCLTAQVKSECATGIKDKAREKLNIGTLDAIGNGAMGNYHYVIDYRFKRKYNVGLA